MSTRGPKSSIGATRQALSPSPKSGAQRIGSAAVDWIKLQIQNEPLWGFFALSGKWLCPYCLSAVNRRTGRSREESISTHLESCRSFNNGQGQIQLRDTIERRQQYENLIHLADTDPAWRVYDQTGSWYCPACLDRIPTVRIQGGQLTNFVYQGMAEHVNRCASYALGVQPKPENVQLARDRAARFPALMSALHNNLQFPVWRYIDAMGLWVCPCCLKHVSRVRIANEADWQRAPEHIAQHLLQECQSYANNPQFIYAEAQVRDASASVAPVVQTPALAPAVNPKTSLLYRTPLVGNNIAGGRTATPANGSPRAIQQNTPPAQNTPPVAKPVANFPTGRFPLTPTHTPTRTPLNSPTATPLTSVPTPPTATPLTNRRIETTSFTQGRIIPPPPPVATPPISPTPISAKWSVPARPSGIVPPAPELPVETAYTAEHDNPAALFGGLDGTFLGQTDQGHMSEETSPVADAVHGDAVHEADQQHDQQHFDWMDEAENIKHTPGKSGHDHDRSDMVKARAVQQGLLQKPPEIPGFSFNAAFEACTDISGDFYHFIRLPDGRVGFAMGDVSGHGVQAGLIMSMAKKTFEIYASMGLGPADTLSKVNDSITRDLGGKLFISMVYALLDPTEHTITWARAGHTPSIRYNPTSDLLEEIKPPGMVVGMKTGAIFRNSLQEQVITVSSGDVIVLYTDGVTETMNLQQEEFETDRLFDVIKKFGADGPDILVSRIMEIIRHFRGPQPPTDDVTLLTLHVE
jgi:serine phosphatase RsbU (regulator of sigma subunit)